MEEQILTKAIFLSCVLFFIYVLFITFLRKKNKNTPVNIKNISTIENNEKEIYYLGRLCVSLNITEQDLINFNKLKNESKN